MSASYERNLAEQARSRFEIEWMAHDFLDEHWKGFFWLSLHPQPFAFPNGGGAHAMLVAHYRVADDPTNDAPYWKLSARGELVMAYLDAVIHQLGPASIKALRSWHTTTSLTPEIRDGRPPPEVMPLLRALAIEVRKDVQRRSKGVALWTLPFGRALIRRVDLLNPKKGT